MVVFVYMQNLNIRIHRDITGEMGVGVVELYSNIEGGTYNGGRPLKHKEKIEARSDILPYFFLTLFLKCLFQIVTGFFSFACPELS